MMSGQAKWLAPEGRAGVVTAFVAVVASIACGVALLVDNTDNGDLPGSVAFTVGEREVTNGDLDARIAVLSALYGVEVPSGADAETQFRRDAAKSMAISIVMDEEAVESGIEVSEDEASGELDAFLNEAGGDRAFDEFLAKHGLTEDDVLTEVKRTISVGRLYESVVADVPRATVREARRVYASDPARFRTVSARVLRNIVVGSHAEAVGVLRRLRAGEPFADVAGETSLDRSTSRQGGLLGAVTQAELEPGFGKAAFGVPVGGLVGPVRSQYGWNVARVDRELPSRQLRFSDVRARLVKSVTAQREQQAWVTWVNNAVADADIEYADAYRPDDPGIDITDGAFPTPEPTPAPTSDATP